jgi:hypothetical protein
MPSKRLLGLVALSAMGFALAGGVGLYWMGARRVASIRPEELNHHADLPESLRFIETNYMAWRIRFARVAGAAGYKGWPDLPEPTAENAEPSKDPLWDGFVHNPRALLLLGPEPGRVDALVLLQQKIPKNAETPSRAVLVRHLESNPLLVPLWGEDSIFSDSFIWRWQQGASDKVESNGSVTLRFPGFQVAKNEPGVLIFGPDESDAISTLVYGLGDNVASLVDELKTPEGMPEGKHGDIEGDFLAMLARKDFERAKVIGRKWKYVWFEVDGEVYAAKRDSWDLWKKGPRPSVTVEPQP